MKLIKTIIIVALFLSLSTEILGQESSTITVTNPTEMYLKDSFIEIDVKNLSESFSLFNVKEEIPYQIFSDNGKSKLGFVIDLLPGQKMELNLSKQNPNVKKQFPPRTYAELAMKPGNIHIDGKFRGNSFQNVTKIKVPAIHKDHDALFKYEGPGWESEKVGYRFYLDWRNATDIFGKKVNELILNKVGVHDTVAKDDSYHQMQEWGMDIFKVGSTLGIGSIGIMSDGKVNMVSKTDSIYCEIFENGPIRSKIRTNYFGWLVGDKKFNLQADLSITAGSRLTKTELLVDGNPDNIVTGLAKYKGTNFIKSHAEGEWKYIALYGNQTLVNENDKLGIALFYKSSAAISLSEDQINHIVQLKPINGKIEYYFCAAWEQEPEGIKSETEFVNYINQTLHLLNNPIKTQIK
ncbi:MAG: DUF4861 family protein [Ignavibacteria bacterium]|nr:DUF4861 family protein [Ignavibacteria bacterium]